MGEAVTGSLLDYSARAQEEAHWQRMEDEQRLYDDRLYNERNAQRVHDEQRLYDKREQQRQWDEQRLYDERNAPPLPHVTLPSPQPIDVSPSWSRHR